MPHARRHAEKFTDAIVDHLKRHQGMFQPLARKLRDCGFSSHMMLAGQDEDMARFIESGITPELYEIAARHARPANGHLEVRLHARPITETHYDQQGHSDIHLAFLRGKAREFLKQMPALIGQIRDTLFSNFDHQTIFDLIDFGADYLKHATHPFSYTIYAFDQPIFDGKLDGDVLRVGILDPPAYIRLGLFFLKGADAVALSIRSPFDILAIFDAMQASLRHLALSYEERGMMIEVNAMGHRLMTFGAGVKSNLFTDRFGPTAVHLDKIFNILTSALASFK